MLIRSLSCTAFFLSLSIFSHHALADTSPCHSMPPVETKHVVLGNLSYTVTVGVAPIHDEANKCIATMSYMTYTKDGKDAKRPLTFVYAGGPGASALSDNFLFSGPKIISLNADGEATGKSVLQDNPETWLKFTDLVYIDMVGSGWGRVANADAAKTIYTPEGDANTFSQFILSYLNKTHNVNRPIFLSGESYGGFRSPIVMNNLLKHFVSVKGVILISPVLDFNYTSDSHLIDYPLYIPTFVRTALYHHALAKEQMDHPDQTIQQAIDWAKTTYLQGLFQGDELPADKQNDMTNQLHLFTGLSVGVIQKNNNRIDKSTFRKELLPPKAIDYLDGRIVENGLKGNYDFYVFHIGSFMSSQLTLYPHAIEHIFSDLQVKEPSDTYINYFDPRNVWKQESKSVLSVLHDDLVISPKTKVFVGAGYYDMDVPYFATKIAVAHLLLPTTIQKNISMMYYPAGHMFYTDPDVRKKLYKDIESFYGQQN